ncbi:hypothetical protein JCM9279_006214 [Rhodotorula babjevae]
MRPCCICQSAAKPRRARSVLLDSPPPPPERRRRRDAPLREGHCWDAARGDVNLRILSSPLRRCLLTNKVLPCEMMVRFELTRPPSPTSSSTSSPSRLVLQPSRILHPRFEDRLSRQGSTGKAMWVTCWSDAVAVLAQKGSYKRLNSSATMLPPPAVTAHVHSLLARRVAHEAELVAERIQAWPAAWTLDARRAPVRRVHADELDEVLRELGDGGRRVVGILDLSPPFSSAGDADPAPPSFSSTLPQRSPSPPARRYHLSTFLAGVVLPPCSLPQPPPPEDPPTPSSHLLAATRQPLDALLDLLSRRLARLDPPSTASPPPPPPPISGDLFVLSAPGSTALEAADEGAQRQAEDLVPLVLALERCRMWSGEGWAEEEEGEREEEEG